MATETKTKQSSKAVASKKKAPTSSKKKAPAAKKKATAKKSPSKKKATAVSKQKAPAAKKVTAKKSPSKQKKATAASKKKTTAAKKVATTTTEDASTTVVQAADDRIAEEVQVLDKDIISERSMQPGGVDDTILVEKSKPQIASESSVTSEEAIKRPVAPSPKMPSAADRLAARNTRPKPGRVAKPILLFRAARAHWKSVPRWTKVTVPLGIAAVMALFLAQPGDSGENKANAPAEEITAVQAEESPECGDVIEHTIDLLPKAAKTVAMQESSTLVAQCERTSPGHRSCVLAAESSLDLAPCAQL
jgi:hypothetical protein